MALNEKLASGARSGAGRKAKEGDRGQSSIKYLFGSDLYCRKEPFGLDLYTQKPPFGGDFYCNVNSEIIYS